MTKHIERLDSVNRIVNPKDLAFLHIPKTGGASVIQVLDHFFDDDAIAQAYNPPDFEIARTASLYRGHMYGEQLARLFPQADHFTIARDPVATMRSMYRWMQTGGRADLWREDTAASRRVAGDDEQLMVSSLAAAEAAGAMSFSDTLTTSDPDVQQRMTAIQVRCLSDGTMFTLAERDFHVAQAAATVDRCVVVGTTEDLEMALWLLCEHRKWPAPPSLGHIHALPQAGREDDAEAMALAELHGEYEIYGRIKQRAADASAALLKKAGYRERIVRHLDRQADMMYFTNAPTADVISYGAGTVWPGTGWALRQHGPAGHRHRLGANGRSVLFAKVLPGSPCTVSLTVRTATSNLALLTLALIVGGRQLAASRTRWADPDGCIMEWNLDSSQVGNGQLRLTFETLGKSEDLVLSSVVISTRIEKPKEKPKEKTTEKPTDPPTAPAKRSFWRRLAKT